MSTLSRVGQQGLSLLPIVLAVLIGGALLYRPFDRSTPQTLLACELGQRPGTTAVRTPSGEDTVGNLRVEGRMENTSQHGMFSLDGSAIWASNEAAEGTVSGKVFLADDGAVEGLHLRVVHPDFSQNELRIATLNSEGILDTDRSTAFLFFDRHEKLSHPVNYVCRISRR